jgi:membrane-bound lytic murein transglycosylase MltF
MKMTTRARWIGLVAALFLFLTALPIPGSSEKALLKGRQNWTGDFDGMVERHRIRALVPYSKTFYFLDGADQRGLTYDLLKGFEKHVNQKLGKKTLRVELVVIPTPRDGLVSGLLEGRGDIAAGNLTVTEGREERVDFSAPLLTGIDEILVTGPDSPPVASVEDLAGAGIHVRPSSSYHDSLLRLNERFRKEGRKPVELIPADELLEDEDLLEMVNAGLLPMVVVDSHKARFWTQVFTDLTPHPEIPLRTGGEIAWAFRKDSPKLKKEVDEYVRTVKKGTLLGNMLFTEYLDDTKWVRRALDGEGRKRLEGTIALFRKYADRYGFDWLMIAALAYQESGIDQGKRSPSGAIGVMQVLPRTAKDPNVGIPDIDQLENNIHAGVKYLRFLRDRYFEAEPMDDLDKALFTFAAYNAGPARVQKLREEARRSDLDPDVWFGNVEVAASKHVGRETVHYVGNIFKYYTAYRLMAEKSGEKAKARERLQ